MMTALRVWAALTLVLLCCLEHVDSESPKDQFDERLLIKPLANGQVLAQFDFTTTLHVDPLQLHWGL
jgi:hypothetical protein